MMEEPFFVNISSRRFSESAGTKKVQRKLTDRETEIIKKRYDQKQPGIVDRLSKQFGVSRRTILRIANGKKV